MRTWWSPDEDREKLSGCFSSSTCTRLAHRVLPALPGQSRNTPCCMNKKEKDAIKSLIFEEGLSLGKVAAAIPLQSTGDVIRCNLHPPIEQSDAVYRRLGCTSGWRCPEGKGWPREAAEVGMGRAAGICSCEAMWQASPPYRAAPGQPACSGGDPELPSLPSSSSARFLLHHWFHALCNMRRCPGLEECHGNICGHLPLMTDGRF